MKKDIELRKQEIEKHIEEIHKAKAELDKLTWFIFKNHFTVKKKRFLFYIKIII